MTRVVPLSRWSTSWVLRAMRADMSVGSARASSSALVWSDCVPPCVAAMASTMVRVTLFHTSWAVKDQPEVWQWVRSARDLSERGAKGATRRAHSSRAALSFATSVKKSMPMAKKKDRRGAKSSIFSPAASPARM